MDAKEFYKRQKHSSWKITPMRQDMMRRIIAHLPDKVFEFGCGRGETLSIIRQMGIDVYGMEINKSEVRFAIENLNHENIITGDETKLAMYSPNQFDVSFTIGVLDHLEENNAKLAVSELQRISQWLYVCETNDVPAEHYYPHDYLAMGFSKIAEYQSDSGDRARYEIWCKKC